MQYLRRFILAVTAVILALPGRATAHPHVWTTVKSEVVYAADGSITGIRHAWSFDEMFSTFATQGLETKQKGVFTREDLAPLAKVNIESLKEFDYFTRATANGKASPFNEPLDYWLDFRDSVLTLNFTLPFKAPVKAKQLNFEIVDPTWFVDFSLAEKDPVALVGAPAQCKLSVAKSKDPLQQGKPSEEFFASTESAGQWAAQFANKFSVTCP
ncbi:MAG TPA: DUF1007 family protein [Xanthobacteraceae bacterium]|nr:DUF1007 family protein [Xanthobacteraceae bacterium]